jgi:hypothetical protein
MIHSKYVGSDPNLIGHRALVKPVPGTTAVDAQFTDTENDDPACLRPNGPAPAANDVRFGWHRFRADEFQPMDSETEQE